jgi:hypothetical protein
MVTPGEHPGHGQVGHGGEGGDLLPEPLGVITVGPSEEGGSPVAPFEARGQHPINIP